LEKPMQLVLDQQLNFDYCLCWANHTWYNKRDNITLQQQQYLGEQDYTAYFNRLLPHFKSPHYLKIENRPIFSIFNPNEIPDLGVFIESFQQLAKQAGFDGIYFIADNTDATSSYAGKLDGYTRSNYFFKKRNRDNIFSYFKEKLTRKFGLNQVGPFCYSYPHLVVDQYDDFNDSKYIPSVFTGWDTTPRHLRRGTILKDFNLQNFKCLLGKVGQTIRRNQQSSISNQIVIIKSWNEWAEGNLLEPDNIFGYQLLEVYRGFIISVHK
ncbi:MAG: glycoside hydrolase family 99-like domain-containing protein, partial [Methylotenera sp.]